MDEFVVIRSATKTYPTHYTYANLGRHSSVIRVIPIFELQINPTTPLPTIDLFHLNDDEIISMIRYLVRSIRQNYVQLSKLTIDTMGIEVSQDEWLLDYFETAKSYNNDGPVSVWDITPNPEQKFKNLAAFISYFDIKTVWIDDDEDLANQVIEKLPQLMIVEVEDKPELELSRSITHSGCMSDYCYYFHVESDNMDRSDIVNLYCVDCESDHKTVILNSHTEDMEIEYVIGMTIDEIVDTVIALGGIIFLDRKYKNSIPVYFDMEQFNSLESIEDMLISPNHIAVSVIYGDDPTIGNRPICFIDTLPQHVIQLNAYYRTNPLIVYSLRKPQ